MSLAYPVMPAQTHDIDGATGIETWRLTADGVSISLTQIIPDQIRAFYVNRGFPAATIESYAQSCVYMAVLRNDTAPGVVRFRLVDWSVVVGSVKQSLVSTETWIRKLQSRDPGRAAMIAFRWAQFPSEQAYQPGGDWNQGMLSIGLPPGTRFDLVARWDVKGEQYEGELKDVRCARENT